MMYLNPTPPVKPWVVLRKRRNPASAYHPWFLELENHYFLPEDPRFRCTWNVNPVDERYDFSHAIEVRP